ncbi:MAG: tRNA uridine-5-carboxymethylaminomethyl(34) synthesis enzyme MnmG [Firmicutes bacterium]|nr:tRNA uridine-5-carboxymethylaminomethyl(34) synthesis enzyme MnmG [Bacillota bacterium]
MDSNKYDAIVVGGGHAGVEAGLALARLGKRVLLCAMSLESISFMACNPNIGGTAKAHLVKEIDALGGQMGVNADRAAIQIKTLNNSKGAAVHSLRAQADRHKYHIDMKSVLERQVNLHLLESEVTEILVGERVGDKAESKASGKTGGKAGVALDTKNKDKCVIGVKTEFGETFYAGAVVVASGVYLNSDIVIGQVKKRSGPSSFAAATKLSDSLRALGVELRRFQTSTPPRILKRSIDFSKFTRSGGEDVLQGFSALTADSELKKVLKKQKNYPCYLGYTNEKTHEIIKQNIKSSGIFSGAMDSKGPRYCPSIEEKIVRFEEKQRHQIFLEPEGENTDEYYLQGIFTGLPTNIQRQVVQSIEGLESAEIMRYAYAIEYDAVNSLGVNPNLMHKKIAGLFFAGQVLGSSGYEEAAAQGLLAGINAKLFLDAESPLILKREESYIGVLIDDLCLKGVDEPYRMMTSRAEHRLFLRQDNADLRLSQYAIELGLACESRKKLFKKRQKDIQKADKILQTVLKPDARLADVLGVELGVLKSGLSVYEALKRPKTCIFKLNSTYNLFKGVPKHTLFTIQSNVKYSGYLAISNAEMAKEKALAHFSLPQNFDYNSLKNLRLEAREKLNKIKPQTLDQAKRITGISPADITVLLLHFK